MTQFNANIIVLAGDESVIVGVLDAMAANYAKGCRAFTRWASMILKHLS